METSAFLQSIQQTLGSNLLSILTAIAVLAVGWLVAVVARAALLRILGAVRLNERLTASTGSPVDLAHPIALTVFWLILLLAVVVMLNVLDIQGAASPLAGMLDKILSYLPQIFAGAVLTLVAWLVAALLRGLIGKALSSTTLDDKLSAEADMKPMSQNVANVVFWLVILLFLPAILGAFQLEGLLKPVQAMMDKILAMLPNIFASVLIGFVGWIVAKVLRSVVVNLLMAIGTDKLGETAGLDKNVKISSVIGILVFVLVFVPSLIAALDALKIEAISGPAIEMLDQMMSAVPNILSAAIILIVAWYVAKFASGLIARLLEGIGANNLPAKLGMKEAFQTTPPAELVGKVFLFFAMLFASVEASNRLGFSQVRDVVTMFIEFGGQILLGGIILAVGFWLANLVHSSLSKAGQGVAVANIARIAIIGLVIAMGLRAMGIADDIVNLAFGLTLGAIAVAAGLSFGLGGRDAAGKQLEHWFARMRGEK